MNLQNRLENIHSLRKYFQNLSDEELEEIKIHCRNENAWFTPESVQNSIDGIIHMLHTSSIEKWMSTYKVPETQTKPKTIGLILAGNLPMVGFHDLLCTYLSGHLALVKCSSQDTYLIKLIGKILNQHEPASIQFVERLSDFDAVIATGSDNSARYFNAYFGKYPHIIRKNRSSIAVLTGEETDQELINLGKDVFDYFGLGCRNVSKLLVPEGFDFIRLGDLWTSFHTVINHHKYANNYDYQKSIYLVNNEKHLDFGYLLLRKSPLLVSPISVLFYDHYTNASDVIEYLDNNQNKLQCIVGNNQTIAMGKTQQPELWDYADGIDTISFLLTL